MIQFEIVNTADGSQSVQSRIYGADFHSTHGAVQESKHVFIQSGLFYKNSLHALRIFELGFGTGLNALLTFQEAALSKVKIDYFAVELHPLPAEIWSGLDYGAFLDVPAGRDALQEMHAGEWNEMIRLGDHFTLTKFRGDWLTFYPLPENIDVFYFDAFAPSCQPELWSDVSMARAFGIMAGDSVLVSYCAQGQFRRNLRAAGFSVEKLSGPPGKREMTRAHKA